MAAFKLSAQLVGHDSDVRALSFPKPDTIFSVSRDHTVRAWSQSGKTFESRVIGQGTEFINSVTYLQPSAQYSDGLVISGGKDTIIEVRKPTAGLSDNAERLLIGHAHNICTLDVSAKGTYIVSGGWDGQARIWSVGKWETEIMLAGHDGMSVWAVLALDERTVVTGCADHNIRIFDLRSHVAGEAQPKSTIYTPDIVRALCRLPKDHVSGADIASSHNDGVIRLWKLTGQMMAELRGHDSFIYSIACLPTGELASAGEDRTVRIWKGTECVQTITHPAISVWHVAVCSPNGDIVSGASDGVARIFSRSPDRVADAETLAAFEDSVKGSAIPQQQMPSINKEKLPGPDFLKTKSGTKEGQVQMIREDDGSVSAHTWSMSQQQWINVGKVVDSAGSSGRKVEYNGKAYDYVFDVDIEDGKPPLKLPYNLSENAYDSARRFLEDNELPISYMDNVVQFIEQNTKGATLGEASGGGPDPYGTEARYRPGDGLPDSKKTIPQTEYLSIRNAKYEAIVNKILNVNKNMISSGQKANALNPAEQSILQKLRTDLETSRSIGEPELILVFKVTSKWPYPENLPGLDLLRCIAPSPLVSANDYPNFGSLVQVAIKTALPPDHTAINENCVTMAIRTVVNMFATPAGRKMVAAEADSFTAFLERVAGIQGEPIGKFNRNVQIAVTTAIINLAVMGTSSAVTSRLHAILGGVVTEQNDSEVLYRALVALGTLKDNATNKKTVREWVLTAIGKSDESRIKDLGAEVLRAV